MTDLLVFKAWGVEATAAGMPAIAAFTAIILTYVLLRSFR